jgi:hypothetical protein
LSGQLLYLAVSTAEVGKEKFSKYTMTGRIKSSEIHRRNHGNARKANANQIFFST